MFRKGQTVHLVRDWDRCGTVQITKAQVYSCGKKQMILTDAATGEELGRHFYPRREQAAFGFCGAFILEDAPAAEIEAVAMQLATDVLSNEREHFARCLAGGHGEGYDAAIRKAQAELHEPRIFWRHT